MNCTEDSGDTVVIEVEDDGRGIENDTIVAQAQARNLKATIGDQSMSLLDIPCTPGFTEQIEYRSSKWAWSRHGCRKAQAVEELGGTLSMQTTPGRGTCFAIQLPLTLAIIDAVIVVVGDERYAVPQTAVCEVLKVDAGTITLLENNSAHSA